MIECGWRKAASTSGASFVGKSNRHTEIDHILVSPSCELGAARYVAEEGISSSRVNMASPITQYE
jgi:hypothetical protein